MLPTIVGRSAEGSGMLPTIVGRSAEGSGVFPTIVGKSAEGSGVFPTIVGCLLLRKVSIIGGFEADFLFCGRIIRQNKSAGAGNGAAADSV